MTKILVKQEKIRCDSLYQSILAKAFRGDLVPQDPGDESASIILEKIIAEREAQKPKKKVTRRRKKSTA